MSTEAQALCFMAGASSIFAGEKLLTTPNPGEDKDAEMFNLLGLIPTEKKKKQPKLSAMEPTTGKPATNSRLYTPDNLPRNSLLSSHYGLDNIIRNSFVSRLYTLNYIYTIYCQGNRLLASLHILCHYELNLHCSLQVLHFLISNMKSDSQSSMFYSQPDMESVVVLANREQAYP